MIDLESIDHIYLFPGSTDLRKGRHSLALLARRIYAGDGLHDDKGNIIFNILGKITFTIFGYSSLNSSSFPFIL